MKIKIENKQTIIKIQQRKIRSSVIKLLKVMDCEDKKESITFVDAIDTIKQLNQQYLQGVLSFSLQEGDYGNINPEYW